MSRPERQSLMGRADNERGRHFEVASFRLAVNKLAINLSPAFVDDRYLKFLIVPQAVIAKILRDLLAVLDCFSVRVEFNADPVSHRNAVFHIEEILLHGQSSITSI
jgi:hypothetical protein